MRYMATLSPVRPTAKSVIDTTHIHVLHRNFIKKSLQVEAPEHHAHSELPRDGVISSRLFFAICDTCIWASFILKFLTVLM